MKEKFFDDKKKMSNLLADDSFHRAVAPVATFVQFLGLMPVCGMSNSDANRLEFKWKSFRTIGTLAYIAYGVFISVTFYLFIAEQGISAKNIGQYLHQTTTS